MGGQKTAKGRTELQDERMRKRLTFVGAVLNVAGVAAMGATIFEESRQIGLVGCLVLALLSVAMYLLFPQYYSLMSKKEYKKAGLTAPVRHLDLAVLAPALGVAMQVQYFYISGWAWLIVLTLILAAAVFALMLFGAREVREYESSLGVVLVVAVALSFGVVVSGNHYLNVTPEPSATYTVIEMDSTSGGRGPSRYVCVVELEPGQEARIPVDVTIYRQLQPGDTVSVCFGTGAFGVEYAYITGY